MFTPRDTNIHEQFGRHIPTT